MGVQLELEAAVYDRFKLKIFYNSRTPNFKRIKYNTIERQMYLETRMLKGADSVVHESDLTLPMLRLLSNAPNGFLETTDLIEKLESLFKPSGRDAEILEGRHDTHFSQKVRNVVSHRDSQNNPIAKGWIEYLSTNSGLKITTKGREILASFS